MNISPRPVRIAKRAQCILSQIDPHDKMKRYLILKKTRNGLWGLAGGAIEPNEDVQEAILRELEEETHLDQKSLRILGEPENLSVSYNYGSPTREIVLFKAEYLTPLIPVNISIIDGNYPQPEHYEFRWVGTYEEIKYLQFGSDDIKKIFKQLLPR